MRFVSKMYVLVIIDKLIVHAKTNTNIRYLFIEEEKNTNCKFN